MEVMFLSAAHSAAEIDALAGAVIDALAHEAVSP
jgi:hypothetical protein